MLSAIFDRNGLLSIYEDGLPVGSVSIASNGDIYTGFPISFGADAKSGYKYRGHIAEVRVFSEVIAPSTIQKWSCDTINSTHKNINTLIGYWRLAEGDCSLIVNDYSSTLANGEISGAVWKNAKDTAQVWEYNFSNAP